MKAKKMVPVETGKVYTIDITDVGSHGEGVGKFCDFTVFVSGALPGEQVEAKIIVVKKNYAKGQLIDIVTPSAGRIQSPCPYFPRCGGCQLLHWDYEQQLAWKRSRVEHLIRTVGKSSAPVRPVVGMERPNAYRNKMQLPIGKDKSEVKCGFYAAGSHRIVDMEHCLIQDAGNNRLLQAVRRIMQDYGMPHYEESSHSGDIRHVIGRTADDGLMAIIVTKSEQLPQQNVWIEELRQQIPELVAIYHNIQPKRSNVILGDETKLIWGAERLPAHIGHLKFMLSPGSFFQVNPEQTEKLYRLALQEAALTGTELVIDAYCGTGTISLFLAQQARRVIGIEIFAPAIADARKNAVVNQVHHAEFIVGDATEVMPELAAQGLQPDVIVMDPARAGCTEEVLQAAAGMQPKRMVYVSCNPATLARDVAILADLGYELQHVTPVDMFPHTTHVETVSLMTRVK